jgi:hypothetical protein
VNQPTISARVGRRGAALMFFVVLDAIYAVALLTAPRPLPPFYGWMDQVMPLTAWAICWAAVGLTCLWYAFRAYDTPAFMAAVAVKVGWGLWSLFGWVVGGVDRAWIWAVIWLGFAGFVYLIAGGIPVTGPRPTRRWSWTR